MKRGTTPFFLMAVYLVGLLTSCTHEEENLPIIYRLRNESSVETGVKIFPLTGSSAKAKTLIEEFILKPGESMEYAKASDADPPGKFIDKISLFDPTFSVFYKDIALHENSIDGITVTNSFYLPDPKTAEFLHSAPSLFKPFIDRDFIYGFFEQDYFDEGITFFRTNDDFKSVIKFEIAYPSKQIDLKNVSGSTLTAKIGDHYDKSFSFLYSPNFGNSWLTLVNVELSLDPDYYDSRYLGSHFLDQNNGWIYIYYNRNDTQVFRFNNGNYDQIFHFYGYAITHTRFVNEHEGYILARFSSYMNSEEAMNTYLFHTTDGGSGWEGPYTVSENLRPVSLFVLNSGRLIVRTGSFHGDFNKEYLLSDDKGKTWRQLSADVTLPIADMHFTDEGIGFIKTGSYAHSHTGNLGFVYKSLDQGESWTKLSGNNQLYGSKIFFHDEHIGYLLDTVYPGQTFYVTRDGGTTWKEIIHPYPYLQ